MDESEDDEVLLEKFMYMRVVRDSPPASLYAECLRLHLLFSEAVREVERLMRFENSYASGVAERVNYVDEMQVIIADFETQNVLLKKNNEQLKAMVTELDAVMCLRENELEESETRIAKLEKDCQILKDCLFKLDEALTVGEKAPTLTAPQAERDAELATLQAERDGKDAELAALKAERDAELATLKEELASLKAERDGKDAELAALKAERDAELATLKEELAALKAESEDQDTEIATLQVTCSTQQAEIATLKAEREDKNAQIASLHAGLIPPAPTHGKTDFMQKLENLGDPDLKWNLYSWLQNTRLNGKQEGFGLGHFDQKILPYIQLRITAFDESKLKVAQTGGHEVTFGCFRPDCTFKAFKEDMKGTNLDPDTDMAGAWDFFIVHILYSDVKACKAIYQALYDAGAIVASSGV